jgi:isopenicillin N synthase-like dioxygenase
LQFCKQLKNNEPINRSWVVLSRFNKPIRIFLNMIPSLDLRSFTEGSQTERAEFVHDLGKAFTEIGFVALRGHGLDMPAQEELYDQVKAFFALSEEQKLVTYNADVSGQRGYTPKNTEKAKGAGVADLKEFYHIGQELPEGHPDRNTADYPDNIWPQNLEGFGQITLHTFRTLEATGKAMLQAIALFLDLDEKYFEDKVAYGNSILRPIHYFPIQNPEALPEGAVRAGAHGDINLITLLMGASADGLQVLRRDGEWISITALPDQLVVNVGDMLDRLTNHMLKSTIHRVVNPPLKRMAEPRYSIPFFMHPRADMDLTPLPHCITDTNPRHYENITAGAFLEERLREIGLRK